MTVGGKGGVPTWVCTNYREMFDFHEIWFLKFDLNWLWLRLQSHISVVIFVTMEE